MPRHVNPDVPERTATAPYNFVPLPNKILTVDDGVEVNGKNEKLWEMHDQFVPGSHNGWIDLTLKTLTPLFIRGPITKIDKEWYKGDSRLRAEPFTNKNGVPAIPGSSLRGMIRSLVEVLSFSKITPVTDERPFFRTFDTKSRIGQEYVARMLVDGNKPSGGFITKINEKWFITPAAEVLRVHHNLLNACNCGIPASSHDDLKYHPSWHCQNKPCWFLRSDNDTRKVSRLSLEEKDGWENGVLVLSGFIDNKHHEFIFLGQDTSRRIEIPESIWRRFHDREQVSQWQKEAFSKNSPPQVGRKSDGSLRDGEPVFYIVNEHDKSQNNPDSLIFLGRAQMFRYPYDLSPNDLISNELSEAGLDITEAIFGKIGQKTIKSRVYFDDSIAKGDQSACCENVIVPRILSSPKFTCFQHYLTQNGNQSKKKLTTYLKGDYTTLRGHKFYWHRWDDEKGIDLVKEEERYNELLRDLQLPQPRDKQHTLIRPVKKDIEFSGRIRFSNLSDMELGALLAALNLPDGCAHKLGMGKPLGLGSIEINTKLSLIEREERYSAWGNDGISNYDADDFIRAFEKAVINHASASNEAITESMYGLSKIGRLQALYAVLDWSKKLPNEKTEYMALETFKERRVLPTPHKVAKLEEPDWKSDLPHPAQLELNEEGNCTHDVVVPKLVTKKPSLAQIKPIGKGQILQGELKRKNESWVAVFDGDEREAVITNKDKIPYDLPEGSKAEFFIMDQSKRKGIKVRFEQLIDN